MDQPEVVSRALDSLVGHPLDEHPPALVVARARRLDPADVAELVRRGAEDAGLLEGRGVAVEVVFTLEDEPGPWVWRLLLAEDDVPEAAGELAWRLLEWRDTRRQRLQPAAPRLLRAAS